MTKARSNATANAAKGDLTVGNGTNLSGVLSVAENGSTIVADSSTSTGLRYTAGTVQSNPTLNSAMQCWQRGTTFASSASVAIYTADRWKFLRAGYGTGATVSRQTTSDSTNLPFIQYAARVQRDSGTTATNGIYLYQNFESINSIPFAGKTVTMSFYARAGANFSSTSSALSVQLITGTGTDQDALLSYTGSVSVISSTATLTTTWQRFTYTATLGSTISELGTVFFNTPVGTAGANDYFEVTGVQIDIGSVALPFRTYAGTIQGELAACQRYFYAPQAASSFSGFAFSASQGNCSVPLPVQMRTAPTVTYTVGSIVLSNTGSDRTGTSAGTVLSSTNSFYFAVGVGSGLTAGQGLIPYVSTSTAMLISAEL